MAYIGKDQKIINDNPELSAYELLTQKGISQGKYEELVASNYKPKAKAASNDVAVAEKKPEPAPERIKPPQPVQPVVRKAADPKLSRPNIQPQQIYQQQVNGSVPMAWLVNKKTGKRIRMTRSAAILAQKIDKASFDVK